VPAHRLGSNLRMVSSAVLRRRHYSLRTEKWRTRVFLVRVEDSCSTRDCDVRSQPRTLAAVLF